MTEYDERQKLAVLQALGIVVIEETHDRRCRLRIMPAVEIKDRDVLRGPWWTGKFPSECVDSAFAELTSLPDGQYVVLDSMGPGRRGVRWNGFMWADVERRDLVVVVANGPNAFTDEQIDAAIDAHKSSTSWRDEFRWSQESIGLERMQMRAAFRAAGARPS